MTSEASRVGTMTRLWREAAESNVKILWSSSTPWVDGESETAGSGVVSASRAPSLLRLEDTQAGRIAKT